MVVYAHHELYIMNSASFLTLRMHAKARKDSHRADNIL